MHFRLSRSYSTSHSVTSFIKQVLLFISLLLLLTACGGGGSSEDPEEQAILGALENEEVDIVLKLSITRQRAAKNITPVSSTQSNIPELIEFDATTTNGDAISGVLFFEKGNLLPGQDIAALLSSKQLRLKALVKKAQGKFVLIGTGSILSGTTPSDDELQLQNIAWTIIAVKRGTQLTGPAAGRIFHYFGDADMKAVCDNNKISSLFRIANPRKQTTVLGVSLGQLFNGQTCNAASYSGAAKVSMDARVVATRIGPLLTSEGFIAPKGVFANAVESFGLVIADEIPGEGDIADVTVNSDTIIIDAEAAAEFAGFYPEYQALVFKSLKGNLSNLKVGDYLVSKPRPKIPNGFLRKVFQIETINGFTAVRTKIAHIGEILESANIHINRSYNQADVEEANLWFGFPERPGGSDIPVSVTANKQADGGDLIDIKVNKVVFDADGDNSTTDDQIKVTGNLGFTPGVVIDLVCSGTLCSKPDFLAKFVLEEETSAKLIGKFKKTLHKSYNLPPSIWLPPITVGPLVFTPKFVIQLNVDGTVSASITYEATQSFTLEAGVDYNPNDGWGTISVFEKDFDNSPPEYEGAIDAKAELAVRGEFKLYGLAGVFADLGGYVQFQAQYPSDPLWTLYGGFGSSVGVDLDVIVLKAEYAWDIFDKRWEISHAPNTPPEPPTLSEPYPKTATKTDSFQIGEPIEKFVQVGAEVTFDAVAWDDQLGEKGSSIHVFSDLEQGRIDGQIGIVKSGEQTGFSYTFSVEGIHTITSYATDEGNTGLTSETSTMQVEVIDSAARRIDPFPPAFSIDRPEVVFDGQSATITLMVEDTRNDQSLPLKVVVDWAVDGEHIRSTGGDADNPMQHTFVHTYSRAAKPARANRSGLSGNDLTQTQQDPTPDLIRNASQIDVTIQYEYEGSGTAPYILTKHTSVKISQTLNGMIIASLSPVSKTFTTDHRPVGTGEEVIYTVTVDYPDKCNALIWSSSDERDAIGKSPVGAIVQADGSASISLTFNSEGSRYITAELVDGECAGVSSKVETRVERYFSGGTGTTAQTNSQFIPGTN